MTVHLLRAPDYAPADYKTVCDLLVSMNMPGWQFSIPETIIDPEDVTPNWGGGRSRAEDVQFEYHSPVEKIMYDPQQNRPLSWQELFDICEYYRRQATINASAVVILLTSRKNALNWFSSFDDKRNVFIHTAGWETFIPGNPAYPIAYEVLANALQLQMALDLENKEECLHEEAIGCMNDFCQNKLQVAYKLRTGDICGPCMQRLKTAEVPDILVDGALQGFDLLRRQMLFRQGFRRQVGPVLINRHHRILFPDHGNLEVSMTALSRTLYIFFLRHLEGVRLANLWDHRAELMQIYESTSGRGSREVMQASINRLTDVREGTMNENISRIRSTLNKTLGEALAQPYQLTGEAGLYRIRLSPDLIKTEN